MAFHISREARDRYQFDETLFSLHGHVIFANFHAVRVFVKKMNDRRDLARHPEQTVRAGQVNAMGLIDEILHYVFGLYREQRNPSALNSAFAALTERFGAETLDKALRRFSDLFPPVAVYKGEISLDAYLEGSSAGVPHRHLVLEEMLMLWLANENPAFGPFLELLDDRPLKEETAYRQISAALGEFFATQPVFGPEDQPIVDMLRSPAVAVPNSLNGQLAYILEKWGYLLGKHFHRLLVGQDLIREDEKGGGWLGAGAGAGAVGRAEVYQFHGQAAEPELFSQDRDWMPKLVLIAKNTYVWLDQLSKKYRRAIHKLADIPDEELDRLARWGVSGLWLIGLWERSKASQKIKQLCGNPDAVASAYSLYDYFIADDLGGEEAYGNLKDRAWRRGIRLASDMVPNHMGIDSRWVIEHPDWFLSLDSSPYPSYSFNGPDLSSDQRVGIFLEDHYYSRSDAAVVFKRVDRGTGSEQYIYHGNDGTRMPWNDTAQLNFLNPAVREAVIQTILAVARKFSIIRFDAAMTLARKHVQRLWFPEPGSGGAIPSRSERGMTSEQFREHMPQEFWREVVDRVAQEVPDTLLLAEAFWMMEGYFVRTLGLHRVYNSAFMNMLKNEDNANYRSVMKNTMAFNPEILNRFVNFMNNPDEDTAVAQFGKEDKYFGVCTMMATLPGLPMFGHGQIEGFTEKYGMEYRRAYRDEPIDENLVQRHEREIFPLLRRRHLFADAQHFLLYDVFTPEGHVNEDVFAYSNRAGEERALVVYHNKYAQTRGWIKTSVGYLGKTGVGEERVLMQKTLAEALALNPGGDHYTIFRDQVSGLEYIRNSRDLWEQGLYVELKAFHYHVFLDFRQVRDNDAHQYGNVARFLGGRGVPSMDEALREMHLQPILQPVRELVNADVYRQLLALRSEPVKEGTDQDGSGPQNTKETLDTIEQKVLQVLGAIKHFVGGHGDERELGREVRQQLEVALQLPALQRRLGLTLTSIDLQADWSWGVILGWVFAHGLGRIVEESHAVERSRSWLDEWLLRRVLANAIRDLGLDEGSAWKGVRCIALLIAHQGWFRGDGAAPLSSGQVLQDLLKDGDVQQFLAVNRYQDVVWYTGTALDELMSWLLVAAAVQINTDPCLSATQASEAIVIFHRLVQDIHQAGQQAGHQVDKLLQAVAGETEEPPTSPACEPVC
jgi:glycosidase